MVAQNSLSRQQTGPEAMTVEWPQGGPGVIGEIRGDTMRALIESQIAAHMGGIAKVLAPYEASSAVQTWHATIRAIEEFINVPMFGINDEAWFNRLLSFPLDDRVMADPARLASLREQLSSLFDRNLAQRFLTTMMQTAAINLAFRQHGQSNFGEGINLDTVGGAVAYFQSRRRHLVSLLYTMPIACQGSRKLAPLDTLSVLLPVVEHSCIAVTTLYQQALLADTFPDFRLASDDFGSTGSHHFQPLENGFLEPERASIQVMYELRRDQIVLPAMEPIDPKKIFSAAELRNSIRLIEAIYARFNLRDSDFAMVGKVVTAFSRHCIDDYFVVLEKEKFRSIFSSQSQIVVDDLEELLLSRPSDYASNTNAFQPFVDLGDQVVSNVNLLSRFLYAFKNVHLGSRRRFQIHAGFIFEDVVKRDLEALGFRVTDIKRINRKEFDIVAIRGEVIYNIQCKNNWIDLSKVESSRRLFVRYNRMLVTYYRRALAKEEAREQLLLKVLGLTRIKHFVVSRFPVITDDVRIVPYNALGGLA